MATLANRPPLGPGRGALTRRFQEAGPMTYVILVGISLGVINPARKVGQAVPPVHVGAVEQST